MHIKGLFVSVVAIFVVFSGCIHEPDVFPEDPSSLPVTTDHCDPDTVYFQNQVLPIFISNCAVSGCHDAISKEDGYILDNYENIRRRVKPGNADDTDLYKVLVTNESEDQMPRDPTTGRGYRLPNEQINVIKTWINQGAINNSCTSCDTTNFTYSGAVRSIIALNCATSAGCHGNNSVNGNFTTYNGLMSKVNNQTFRSRVLTIKDMPPGRPLSECEQTAVRKWLDGGALNH